MAVDIYAPQPGDALSLRELDLYHRIMAYRRANGLDDIPLSKSLTATAGRHAIDTYANIWAAGLTLPPGANLHSWSDAPYFSDHRDPRVMWDAPERIGTPYTGNGFEISAAGFGTNAAALEGWQGSPGHNTVIVNSGPWAALTWRAIGVGIEIGAPGVGPFGGRIYHVWFGADADPAGVPEIRGTDAGDRADGTRFADSIDGGAGNDTIKGANGDDTLIGGEGDDGLAGSGGHDDLRGEAGRDRLAGAGGNDTLDGGEGNDRLDGGGGRDLLTGGAGNDRLDGGAGNDTLRPGAGTDTIVFARAGGHDVVEGFDARDTLLLDQGLWDGGLTGAEVAETFGSVARAGITLSFAGGESLFVAGVRDLAQIGAQIEFL